MRLLPLLLVLLVALPVMAQDTDTTSATFKLHITDFDTGIVLQYAIVQIEEQGIIGQTDENGVVELTGIPPGVHVISIECERYTSEVLVIAFNAGDVKEGDLGLVRAPIELGEIEIVEEALDQTLNRRGFYERQEKGGGRFVTKSEMDRKGKILLSEALRGLRGVSIINFQGSNVVVSRRRGKTCPLYVFLDGLRMRGTLSLPADDLRPMAPPMNAVDIDTLPVEEVVGVEVYIGPSEVPIQYNQFNACGVLLIWTRT